MKTSQDVDADLKKAWSDLYNFDHDWTHYIKTSEKHIGGHVYIGGAPILRDEYKETRKALLQRIDDLKTLKGMHLHDEFKKTNNVS